MNKPKVVLMFDRDMTINVNFDAHMAYIEDGVEDPQPVPLRWVKYWAHSCPDVHVWATGNQHLCREAAIPGIAEAKETWDSQRGYDPADVYEDEGYHSYKPARREGLRLIQDLYNHAFPDFKRFVVVDDANLRDMYEDGFRHYFPWNFRTVVEEGRGPADIPEEVPYTDTSVESKACKEEITSEVPI